MSDQAVNRCEPPGHLRWVDGWHWLDGDQPIVAYWSAASDYVGASWRIDSTQYSSQGAHKHGYRYLAPVAAPPVRASTTPGISSSPAQNADHRASANLRPR